ncbi:adenylate/guanylate cyclase domain-containing protein [Thiosulfatimonas sediminis]|uniref:Adenylate/guanylate cyclase domain-containing protein n=1 Tax=Thiosulfatimonas sediminis TaxID=2675054 RepID=A0A6F8PSI1_9GAMM|nr:adenylate/guanylate cyclase domain-containing protein [Thiosulfatimonas sediminis]BBP45092.1 adenylate/guanylate cyclase domain-containing protein [Thiosulfatimonas sediminis]
MRGLKNNLVLIGLAILAFSIQLPTLQQNLYDFKVPLRSNESHFTTPIVIVAIDETSLQNQGHWPWPRERLTVLLKTLLDEYQATAVGLHLLLPENGQMQQDKILADLINRKPITTSLAFNLNDRLYSGYLNQGIPVSEMSPLGFSPALFPQAKGWVGVFHDLATTPRLSGHLNANIDSDGKIRRIPLFIEAQNMLYPQMTLAMLYELLDAKQDPTAWTATLPKHLAVKSTLIPYDFPNELIPVISAQAIFAKTAPPSLLENSLVLIGATAAGVGDVVATPMANQLPSVYLQAYLLNAALGQRWLITPPLERELTALGFVVWTLLLILVAQHLRTFVLFGLMIFTLSVLWISNVWQFVSLGVHWDFSPWFWLFSGHFIWLVYQRYQFHAQRSKTIEQMFKSYVPPTVLHKLIAGQFEHLEQGERRKITVMFVDLVAFTQLAENSDPRELTQLTRSIFNTLTPVILSHQGTIDKYMGDSIMAFWGAPLADDNQAHNAALSALEMRRLMHEKFPNLGFGIGIHTGEAIVGNVGSDFRHAYSALGDTVNIAARIERQTRRYPHSILLSKQTALESGLLTEWVDECQLKGKQQCVSLYTLAS